jgi:hypothetical protein
MTGRVTAFMTRLRGSWPATAALLLLTACAGTGPAAVDTPGAPASPGPRLVLQVRQIGGFVAAATNVTRLPLVSVYADGTVITEGPQIAIYPAPALPNVQVHRIGLDAVDALADRAVAAGVKTGTDLGDPPVADVPTTRFTVTTDAGTQTLDAIALTGGTDMPGLTAPQRAARAKLTALLNDIQTATDVPAAPSAGPSSAPQQPSAPQQTEPYVPTALAAVGRPYVKSDDGLSAQPAVPWPGPAFPGESLGDGPELGCVTASGADLAPLMAAARSANAATAWSSGGKQWSVTFRPLLPEESGCDDLRVAQ